MDQQDAPRLASSTRRTLIVLLVIILIFMIAHPRRGADRPYDDVYDDVYGGAYDAVYDDVYGGAYDSACGGAVDELYGELGVDVGPYDEHRVGYNDGIPEAWALPSTPIRWLQPAHRDYYGPEGPTVSTEGLYNLSVEDHDPLVA